MSIPTTSQSASVLDQFKALIFTMQEAWPQIHAHGSESVCCEWSALMRSYGDFADSLAKPSDLGNMRMYQALRESAHLVLDELWLSDSMKSRYGQVLRDHLSLDWRIRRLAFVNGWGDQVLTRMLAHLQALPDEALRVLKQASDDLGLAVLRDGDSGILIQGATSSLGFSSPAEFTDYLSANPPLSQHLKARPALGSVKGLFSAASLTEVVFESDTGLFFVERAKLKVDPLVGDWIEVGDMGSVRVTSVADSALLGASQSQQDRPRA